MGFANPVRPVDYDLIGQLVADGAAVDYGLVRAACDLALASTDNAISALSTLVNALPDAGDVQAAAEAALASTDAAISSLSAILSEVQTRPDVPGWSGARKTALTDLVAIGAAIDVVTAQLARVPDASPEASAVVAALEAEATARWTDVK